MNLTTNNCCEEGLMATCSCNGKGKGFCTYYVEGRNYRRCMFYRFDAYCDNATAQIDSGTELVCPEYSYAKAAMEDTGSLFRYA